MLRVRATPRVCNRVDFLKAFQSFMSFLMGYLFKLHYPLSWFLLQRYNTGVRSHDLGGQLWTSKLEITRPQNELYSYGVLSRAAKHMATSCWNPIFGQKTKLPPDTWPRCRIDVPGFSATSHELLRCVLLNDLLKDGRGVLDH